MSSSTATPPLLLFRCTLASATLATGGCFSEGEIVESAAATATKGTGGSTDNDTEADESGDDAPMPAMCVPPPLLKLDEIPDDPSLDPNDDDIVATFEVDGHDLVGKYVVDEDAARKALPLWQELTLRIPENQLQDLVQLDISLDTDPAAYFNRTGDTTASRPGLKIGFSVVNFGLNQDDPCAPLEPRRGTFDWSLVHEFGHLRGFVDESWFRFLDTFPDVQGDGEGYPEDGSPILTGDFVTSYAERADGDEDHAESWTTYVMLPVDALPPKTDDEPLALQKVRWMDEQPGLRELREALRVTEADAVAVDVAPAPRIDTSMFDGDDDDDDDDDDDSGVAEIEVPPELHGTWRESGADGFVLTFTADDIVIAREENGVEIERLSLADEIAAGGLEYFEIHGGQPTLAYSFIRQGEATRANHDFFLEGDPSTVLFVREELDTDTRELEYLPDVTLNKVP